MNLDGCYFLKVRKRGKEPITRWKDAGNLTTAFHQVEEWLQAGFNYGVACGPSGLLVVDEDEPGDFARWLEDYNVPFTPTFTVSTPSGGKHYYYRQGSRGIGNPGTFKKYGYKIDVRGAGGYVVGPGSHTTGPYQVTTDTRIADLPEPVAHFLTDDVAQAPSRQQAPSAPVAGSNLRPGDRFNQEHNTPELLADYLYGHGWQLHHQAGGELYLTRPGKEPRDGSSATVKTVNGRPGLYVFSTSTEFDSEKPYDPFACYSMLEHGGDFQAAARALAAQYGASLDFDVIFDLPSRSLESAPQEAHPGRHLELVDLRSFDMAVSRFAKRDWYPLGDVSIVSGSGGIGKSCITLADVAAATRGELEGDLEGPQHCILLCHEDAGGTIRARLTAAGADLALVHLVRITETTETGTYERIPDLNADLLALEAAVTSTGATIVVIDPIQSYVEGDDHRREVVRKVLDPLISMVQRTGIALIGVAHTNKGGGKSGDKISGSHAWRDACRSHLFAAGDKNTGEKSITLDKSNHTDKAGTSWAFETVGVDVEMSDGTVAPVPVARVIGETDLSAEAIINRAPDTEGDDRNPAQAFLLDYLEEHGGEGTAKDILKAGQAAGFDNTELKNARRRSRNPKITSEKSGGRGTPWVWRIDDGDAFGDTFDFPAVDQQEPAPQDSKVSKVSSPRKSDTLGKGVKNSECDTFEKEEPLLPLDDCEKSKVSTPQKQVTPLKSRKLGDTLENQTPKTPQEAAPSQEPNTITHPKYGVLVYAGNKLVVQDPDLAQEWRNDGQPDLLPAGHGKDNHIFQAQDCFCGKAIRLVPGQPERKFCDKHAKRGNR